MKSLFLIKQNHKKLIIFFNGWSLDENIVKHMTSSDYNVLMFYDYCNLKVDLEILNEIEKYQEINIIAFSFGVWACSCIIDKFKDISKLIVINGTPIPIDNNYGIPEKIFDLTLNNLSEKTYPKFFQNMFGGEVDLEKIPKRTIENQREELQQIKNNSEVNVKVKTFKPTKIFVGLNDKIIPAKNQIDFWRGKSKIIKKQSGHYIDFESWDEIING